MAERDQRDTCTGVRQIIKEYYTPGRLGPMTTSDLVYPLILIGTSGDIHVCIDEDWLTTMNRTTLKSGGYNGCVIVDSEGRWAKVEDTVFVSGKGSFWGYTIFMDRIIRVELLLSHKAVETSLDDVKQRVLRYMKADLGSVGDTDQWLGEMRKIKEAQTVRGIAEILLPYYDNRPLWRSMKKL
jgi:hypothetical protein